MTDEEEVVSPQQEEAAEVVSDMQLDHGVEPTQEEAPREEHVPLSKLLKERKKRQELEQRYQELSRQQTQKDDTSMYESATKQDLGQFQRDTIRAVEERQWINANPEKYERLEEDLSDFLQKKPHLTAAIREAPNRYEEAYALMDALQSKQQPQAIKKEPVKKVAPNAPSSVPKSAGIKEAQDVMYMNDAEFAAYKKAAKLKAKGR